MLAASSSAESLRKFADDHTSLYVFRQWWRITDYDIFKGGSVEVGRFIETRPESRRQHSERKWDRMLGDDWMRVKVERVREAPQQIARAAETHRIAAATA